MAQNYVLLERIELNASAASVTFSNIPQSGYTDLKVVCSTRGDVAAVVAPMYVSFNGSTSTFTGKELEGNGSAASSSSPTRWAGSVNGASATANVFANSEFYIPNYTSSNNKSFSSDGVSENNATEAYTLLVAGLWSTTSAITSIAMSPSSGNFVANSTFSLYGLAALGTTPVIAPKASGGNITTDGTYWIHTFNTTDVFTPQTTLSCDYLVVAGGGGGGGGSSIFSQGGGGGAGGYLTGSSLSVSATAYTITVGAGGSGGTGASNSSGTAGTNSVFSTITATSGGYGGGGNLVGGNGGSGGGGGDGAGFVRAGGSASPSGQGYNGGSSEGNNGAGGGGGASQVGENGGVDGSLFGGDGGNGLASSITGTSVTYAGGGGGGGRSGGSTGGTGGGGAGSQSGNGTAGTVNTGGGGGGASNGTGAAGGSGVVIIRYLVA